MSEPKEIIRNYTIEDAVMLEFSKTERAFFIEDKADFIAFDPAFADPYVTIWQTAITTAENTPGDDALLDQLLQLTNTVEAKMKLCREKFQNSKYFIEKAFPDDIAVWNEFGYNDYEGARHRQSKLIEFMNLFFITAKKYKVKLIAKNYTQAMIDEINTVGDALNLANVAQEKFKKDRPVKLQDRIKLFNAEWEIVKQVARVGKLIYTQQDNFAKYKRYLLPPDEQAGFPKEGTVDANSTLKIYHPQKPLPAGKLFKFKNTGTTQLIFCLAAAATDACGAGVIIPAGTEETHPASDLGDLANLYLNVTNDGAVEGSWEVDEA